MSDLARLVLDQIASDPAALERRCCKGHPLVGENLRVTPQGRWRCRRCAREQKGLVDLTERPCVECGEMFMPKVRREARYCSKRCSRRAFRRGREQAKRAWLDGYRQALGCVDCGTREGRLDFDHRDGEDKRFNLANGTSRSWAVLKAEAAKCDVRCVSCHRKRHAAAEARTS